MKPPPPSASRPAPRSSPGSSAPPQGDDVPQRVQNGEPVDVHVGHDPLDRHRRMLGEVVAAQQSRLLPGDGQEEYRAVRPLRQRREGPRHLEQRGAARGVVERAVVDRVAPHRLADAEVVEVRGVHHDLVPQAGVGAAQQPGDIGTLEPFVHAHRAYRGSERQVECGRLPGLSGVEDRAQRLRRAFEEPRRRAVRQHSRATDGGPTSAGSPFRSSQRISPRRAWRTTRSQGNVWSRARTTRMPTAPRRTTFFSFARRLA